MLTRPKVEFGLRIKNDTLVKDLLRKRKSIIPKAVTQRCSVKKVLLEIFQNLQENTFARVSFLIKLQFSGLQLYLKRDSGTGVLL